MHWISLFPIPIGRSWGTNAAHGPAGSEIKGGDLKQILNYEVKGWLLVLHSTNMINIE